MMRYYKHFVLLLFLILAISFSACGNEDLKNKLKCEDIPTNCWYNDTLYHCEDGVVKAHDCPEAVWLEKDEYVSAEGIRIHFNESTDGIYYFSDIARSSSANGEGIYDEDPSGKYPKDCNYYVRENGYVPDGDDNTDGDAVVDGDGDAVVDGDDDAVVDGDDDAVVDGDDDAVVDGDNDAVVDGDDDAVVDGDDDVVVDGDDDAVVDGDDDVVVDGDDDVVVDGDDDVVVDGDDDVEVEEETSACSNGVCTDPVSGLEWQQVPSETELLRADAITYCSTLDLDGGGWYLPNISELRSLVRNCDPIYTGGACPIADVCTPCGTGVDDVCLLESCRENDKCSPESCPDTGGPNGAYWLEGLQGTCGFDCFYWSSSAKVTDTDYNWGVDFFWGYVGDNIYIGYSQTRCVRSN